MADDQNIPIQGSNNVNPPADGGVPAKPKKVKTEQQRAKERERRKRRRKKAKPQFPAGKDVPLILSSKVGAEKEAKVPEDVVPKDTGSYPAEAAPLQFNPVALKSSEEEVPVIAPEMMPPSAQFPAEPPEEQRLEETSPPVIQPILEESLTVEPTTFPAEVEEPAPESLPIEEENEPVKQPVVAQVEEVEIEQKPEVEPEQELEPEVEPTPELEPTPIHEPEPTLEPSQKIFEESPTYGVEESEEKQEPQEEVISEHDLEKEKKDHAKQIMDDLHGEVHTEGLAEAPQAKWILGNLMKAVGGVIVVGVLGIAAFWAGSSLHLPDLVKNWFAAKPAVEQLAQGDNSKVVQDQDMLNHWGFQTARVFSMNQGDVRNLAYNIFFVANYFGKLKDPIFYGETGISAALYYGFGREAQYFANKFIYYVKYLGQIRQANSVDVNSVLNGKVKRDLALDKYIADTQAIFDRGNTLRKEINVQIDDLQVSINSLTPDHDRFQADFFNSLEQIQAEKADGLIKKFIENSQKQVELKAKIAAMTRLSTDYTDDLLKMKLRIEGLQKNRAALIEGVTVTPVPGSDINLVNQ